MTRTENNMFISRMNSYMSDAMKFGYKGISCAEEIKPMLTAFFEKSINAEIEWDESNEVCWFVEQIAETAKFLAQNTRGYERLSDEDVDSLTKLFEELDKLHAETLELNSNFMFKEEFSRKIICINEILCKNMIGMYDYDNFGNYRDGMIFQSYDSLWKIIHRINTEWLDLVSRGFSIKVFYDYWSSFEYDRSLKQEETEEEKLKTFMGILDGKKKFVPVYESKPVCFKVMDSDFKGRIVKTVENKYIEEYQMLAFDEQVR